MIWASPRFGRLHSQKPSDMGISFSHYLSGLRVRVRVTGDAHVTRVLGMAYAYHCDCTRKCMLFLSPVSSRFVVVLVLFQFGGPDYLRAWNRLVSMTSNPGITLSRAYSFIDRLFPKILFSIMRLFITAFLQSHTHEYLLLTVVELNTAWESKLLSKTKPIQWK